MGARNELVEAFASAVPFALREMANVEAVARDACRNATAPSADLFASIRLTAADGEGRLVLCFSTATATALARRVLADVTDDPSEEMVRDCLGEVANVVAGQAKALLVGSPSHFTLSAPTVWVCDAAPPAHECWEIAFASDVGEFTVRLYPPT